MKAASRHSGMFDPEDEPPAQQLGEHATEGGAHHRRHAPHARDVPLHLRALPQRVQVADDGHPDGLYGARAEALQATGHDQHRHAPGQAAEHRPEQEHRDAVVHQRLAAELVRELAVDGHGRGLGEQVDREQPGELPEAAEVRHDRRHRGGHDGLVERHQGRREHHRHQDRAALRAQPHVTTTDLGGLRPGFGVGHPGVAHPAFQTFPACPRPGRSGRRGWRDDENSTGSP